MKNVKTAFIFIAAISVLIFTREADAQTVISLTDSGQIVDCAENSAFTNNRVKNVNSIIEQDYPYLKSIECLTLLIRSPESGFETQKPESWQ